MPHPAMSIQQQQQQQQHWPARKHLHASHRPASRQSRSLNSSSSTRSSIKRSSKSTTRAHSPARTHPRAHAGAHTHTHTHTSTQKHTQESTFLIVLTYHTCFWPFFLERLVLHTFLARAPCVALRQNATHPKTLKETLVLKVFKEHSNTLPSFKTRMS
jgi:hypothetical protein